MPIRVLPPSVAARIAAGEVVERPASVAKELVENALDAGARSVVVEVAGGGVDLLRVADDGAGVPPDEVPLAFARHATSKLADLDDLRRLTTLGFRGEALPSIAAVAEVQFLTRPADQPDGTLLVVHYGTQVELRRAPRAPGTTVTVEHLFGRLPARRKFLKAPSTEAGHVAHLVSQLALGWPQVRFDLRIDGRQVLTTPGRGDARAALAAVYGPAAARALLALPDESAEGGVRVRGYVSPPELHRGTRSGLTLFVNGRLVYSRTLLYAIEEAYHTLLPVGRHPLALLWLEVPPEEVDVNVHPTKQEVRFLRERVVFAALQRAVRSVIAAAAGVPVLAGGGRPAPPATLQPPPAPSPTGTLFPAGPATDTAPLPPPPRLARLRVLGQVGLTYITAEGDAGLYLIDQHAAHERVLLEQLRRNAARREGVQYLLEPQPVDLSPAQAAALRDRWDDLAALGFVVETFGPRTLLLRAIPAPLKPTTIARVLHETLEALAEETEPTDWRERLCLLLACKAAVKAGQVLSLEEMCALLEQLDETELGRTCAHGRPTAVLLTHSQLEREFGRR
ncbi:MAG TPA: DNA mismatch repair endonuclease MutL [Chloroflexota bacterium]|nr:DNA mismatch repair endonuclease MutL [Chloroflexota bacterium]